MQDEPVRQITLKGFRFAHTASTFLELYEIPSLSDWAIHRGGAIFLQGARDCTIKDCFFDAVGGNAVFMNGHNRGNVVTGCRFTEAKVDAMEPVVMRYNFFEESSGWGLDLDDGASNYEI